MKLIEESVFYRSNYKIKKNIWKPYIITLGLSTIVIFIEYLK